MAERRGMPRAEDTESPHRILARRMLDQWAIEMNNGAGAPNILAVFERLGDGDPAFHVSPGPIFSPLAERADMILRDMWHIEPRMAHLLIATALEVSHQRIAAHEGTTKHTVQRDLSECYGAFSMGMYYRGKVLKEWSPTKRPKKMIAADIGIDTTAV